MAHPVEWAWRVRCSYKRATLVVCAGNLLVALYMLHALLVPLYLPATPASTVNLIRHQDVMRYSQAQLNRIKEANEARRDAEPLELIQRVKEIQEASELEITRNKITGAARQKVAAELAQRLRELKLKSQTNQQALDDWRRKKLEGAKKREAAAKAAQVKEEKVESAVHAQEDATKTEVQKWQPMDEATLAELGLSDVEEEGGGMLRKGAEIEDGIIPGRSVPAVCQAEAHTDYDGVAVRWGLTHHTESAADCCEACMDQARGAREGEKKCNVWVFCPAEEGCFSPDIYEHKHQECWLKQ